jgi:hypothetical protein
MNSLDLFSPHVDDFPLTARSTKVVGNGVLNIKASCACIANVKETPLTVDRDRFSALFFQFDKDFNLNCFLFCGHLLVLEVFDGSQKNKAHHAKDKKYLCHEIRTNQIAHTGDRDTNWPNHDQSLHSHHLFIGGRDTFNKMGVPQQPLKGHGHD